MLINMMVTMMPLMKPLMYAAFIAVALGVLFGVARYAFKAKACPMVKWSSRVVLAIAIFFLASQLMGELLSMPPTFNLGDANNFEFILISFWKVGAALLAAGIIVLYSCKLQSRKTAS